MVSRPRAPRGIAAQRALLESLYARYHDAATRRGDPVEFAHRYADPADREVAALFAAAFAMGNITAILARLEDLFGRMGPRPAQWLAAHEPAALAKPLAGASHRWIQPGDVAVLAAMVGGAIRQHGSLGALWRAVAPTSGEDTVAPALGRFVEALHAQPRGPLTSRARTGTLADGTVRPLPGIETVLFTHPARGSACKRMMLFLRWMVRPADGVDLGLWGDSTPPAKLVVPLDTHIQSAGRWLGWTRRATANLAMAMEITAALRRLDPADPCRYDFALVRARIDGLIP
jgi:uncharacterized protein (TIGR02757 family)